MFVNSLKNLAKKPNPKASNTDIPNIVKIVQFPAFKQVLINLYFLNYLINKVIIVIENIKFFIFKINSTIEVFLGEWCFLYQIKKMKV